MEQPGKNKNGAVASAVFGARWWIGATSTGADGSDPFWHCLWRDAFAHLRSVAAGRGGAAGSKLTQERTRLVAAKRSREECADAIEAGQVARVAPVQRIIRQAVLQNRASQIEKLLSRK